jgi:hypothetical protein
MPAPTHHRPGPAYRGGVDFRLRWWAIVLPSAAFFVLLLLILNPVDAHTASVDPGLAHVLQSLRHTVLRQNP